MLLLTIVLTLARSAILASGSRDRTIKLWDVKTGKLLSTLSGHNDRVNSVSFGSQKDSQDPLILVSGSDDNAIKFWELDTTLEALLKRSCDRVSNYLTNNPVSEEDKKLCP